MKALQNSLQNFEGCMASRLQIFRARDKIRMEKTSADEMEEKKR